MKMTARELTPLLLRLLFGAGLVDRPTLNQFAERNARGRTLLDIMTQDVSLETFRDLLTAEVSFKRNVPSLERELFQGLSASGMIGDDELQQLLSIHRPPFDGLLESLRADGQIDEATAERLTAGHGDGAGDYERLIDPANITADQVCQWLSHSDSRQVRRAAIYLATQFFHFNALIDDDDLADAMEALRVQDLERIAARLRERIDLSASGLRDLLDRNLEVPSVDLDRLTIPPELFGLFPQSLIRRQVFVPFHEDSESIGVVVVDPFNVTFVALLEWATGRWPQPAFAPAAQIFAQINGFYGREAGRAAPLPAGDPAPPTPPAAGLPPFSPVLREGGLVADNVSAVQLVSSIVESAIDLRTTDIHIEPTREGLGVRFRIDGELHRILAVPAAMAQPLISRVKVLAEMDVTERRRPQDGHFELSLADRTYDFRISTLPSILGEKIVIRILDSTRVMSSMENLGLLPEQHDAINSMLERPHGMILVTGPTGSGKTSTLYSALHQLNHERSNLVTIEDPVEYQLPGINQVQVDPNIDLEFAHGLRAILRQDPDVIMIGEIRDGPTAQIAIRAAMTGHLLLSTLHTNTALGALDALVNLGAMRFMLAASLIGILSQRLLRRLCDECKKPVNLTPADRAELGIDDAKRKRIRRAVGCEACLGTGYLGRTGAFEVIRVSDRLRPMISDHRSEQLEAAVRAEGVMTLHEAAVVKVLEGITSVDEVRRKLMLEI